MFDDLVHDKKPTATTSIAVNRKKILLMIVIIIVLIDYWVRSYENLSKYPKKRYTKTNSLTS